MVEEISRRTVLCSLSGLGIAIGSGTFTGIGTATYGQVALNVDDYWSTGDSGTDGTAYVDSTGEIFTNMNGELAQQLTSMLPIRLTSKMKK